jgi:aminoglycoside phosphotransferase family enzyme
MQMPTVLPPPPPARKSEVPLEAKLRFLQSASAYPHARQAPECVETHMSWVFLSGDRVYKLKKPVRLPVLDFSTLDRREFFCREELRLNARLAPDVYLGLLALQTSAAGWSLVHDGEQQADATTVDWLVLMRRLPVQRMLAALLAEGTVAGGDIDALNQLLGTFYRRASSVQVSPEIYVERLRHEYAVSRKLLLMARFELHGAACALDAFAGALSANASSLRARAAGGHLVEGHGDLRPEHICLIEEPVVIDCLEFNTTLRQVDPFDEIAFLALECEIAGAPWIGAQLITGLERALGESPPTGVMTVYTAHRALLRARLSIAHLLDQVVRTPQRWPAQAQRYIDHARRTLDSN